MAKQHLAFGSIDGTDTQNFNVFRVDRMCERCPEQLLKTGKAACKGKGCSMQIAAVGTVQRMKVRMGIEPQNK